MALRTKAAAWMSWLSPPVRSHGHTGRHAGRPKAPLCPTSKREPPERQHTKSCATSLGDQRGRRRRRSAKPTFRRRHRTCFPRVLRPSLAPRSRLHVVCRARQHGWRRGLPDTLSCRPDTARGPRITQGGGAVDHACDHPWCLARHKVVKHRRTSLAWPIGYSSHLVLRRPTRRLTGTTSKAERRLPYNTAAVGAAPPEGALAPTRASGRARASRQQSVHRASKASV